MKKFRLALGLFAFLCLQALSQTRKLSTDLAQASDISAVEVIVQWNIPIGTATAAAIRGVDGTVISNFQALDSGIYRVPGTALAVLQNDSVVRFVSANRSVRRKLDAVPYIADLSASAINAPYVWDSGYTGKGIGVAILDSGITPVANLGSGRNSSIVYVQDFTPEAFIEKGKQASRGQGYGQDWYGHGEHVAGIIASNGKSSNGLIATQSFVGISPGVNLIDLKVLDERGEGSDASVIAAINEAILLKDKYNIRVMNLSLGRPIYESYRLDPLCQAVEAAWKAGIVVVVAAGNDGRDNSFGNQGYATITAPGNDPDVITVGAMKTMGTPARGDDLIASYSSKGPSAFDHIVKPDIVAPGNLIVSLLAPNGTLPAENPANAVPLSYYLRLAPVGAPVLKAAGGAESALVDGPKVRQPAKWSTNPYQQPPPVKFGPDYSQAYYILSGTSMAAAVVSGAAADLVEADPELTPDQVKTLLMMTAYKTFPGSSSVTDPESGQVFTDYYDIFTVGAGYLDLKAALKSVNDVPSGPAMSPTANYDPATGQVTLSYDPASVYGDQAVWGARSVWGANAIYSSSVLDGQRAVWGARSVWGAASPDTAERSVWGARAVWGASAGAVDPLSVAGEQ